MGCLRHCYNRSPPLALGAHETLRQFGHVEGQFHPGRALLMQPEVLLLDEPTEGLSPVMVDTLGGWLEQLRAAGLTILLTEQSATFALRHADRGYILEKGKVRAEGTAQRLREGTELHDFLGAGRNGGSRPGQEPVERP